MQAGDKVYSIECNFGETKPYLVTWSVVKKTPKTATLKWVAVAPPTEVQSERPRIVRDGTGYYYATPTRLSGPGFRGSKPRSGASTRTSGS